MVRVRAVLDILACLAALLGVAPLIIHLDRAPQIIFPIAVTTAFLIMRKWARPLSGFLPTAVSGLFFIFYALQFSSENPAGPAANILVVLLSVRLVSEKEPRHYLQISALSLFCLAASSIFSLGAAFLVYMVLMLLCIAVSLVLLTFLTVDREASLTPGGLKRVALTAAALPVSALPLILVFFVVMPRPQYPLWDLGSSTGKKVTGFSEKVEPGSSSRVEQVKTPVLRAEGEKLPTGSLYWRGVVLNTPSDKAWVRTEVKEQDFVRLGGGAPVRQTLFPESGADDYLITLDVPIRISGIRSRQAPDLVYTRARSGSGSGRIRYEAFSSLGGAVRVSDGIDREFYLTLPGGLSQRIRSLGERIAREGRTDRERLSLLEGYFSSEALRYSTRDMPQSGDPLDQFLFDKKGGNCEFFASSFALLLRIAGVPSRLVAGYYGGEYNELGGYYLVTEEMAHVWVEVYLEGAGWVRRDPSSFAVNFAGERGGGNAGVLHRLRMLSDSLNYYWNLAVITYDLDKQIRILVRANRAFTNLSPPFGKIGLILVIAAAGLVAASYILLRWLRISRRERLVRRFLRRVGRRYPGESISLSTGLNELAERVNEPVVRRFVEIYSGALYRDRDLTHDEMAVLKRLVKRI